MSNPYLTFHRSNVQFFHQESVKESLAELASYDRLVIYCGSGVTINRTDLGWAELLSNVFTDHAATDTTDPTPAEIKEFARLEDPKSLASMLVQYRSTHEGSLTDVAKFLVPRLQQQLYKKTGWQAGMLTRNVIRLAVAEARAGKEVLILTTNYDTYLEDAYDNHVRRLKVNETDLIPGLSARVLKVKKLARDVQSKGPAARVELLYLHGRVPAEGKSSGRLVVSEVDYAETRAAVVDAIAGAIGRKTTGTLILTET